MSHLVVRGTDGKPYAIKQSNGLSIVEHATVLSEMGKCWYTWKEVVVGAGQSAVIKINVPEDVTHHAESRLLKTKSENIRIRIYNDVENSSFPSVVESMPVVNNNENFDNVAGTTFDFCGVVVSSAVPTSNKLLIDLPVWVTPAQGPNAASPVISASLKGRHSSGGIKAVILENIGTDETTVYYKYDWHEYA